MANTSNEITSKANGPFADYKNKGSSIESDFDKMTHDAGERMGAMANGIVSTASDYAKTSQKYVKENPAKGVALAVAAGALAGSLITMLARRSK